MAAVPTTEARVWFRADREPNRFLPEGPQPLAGPGPAAVLWVNIQTDPDAKTGCLLVRPWDGGATTVYPLPGRPGFVCPTDRPGVVLVGCEKTFGLYDLAARQWTPVVDIPDADPRTIINDGATAPGGRAIVFGTKAPHAAGPIAHLYLLTLADNRVTVLADKQQTSNGKVFARDAAGLVLYDVDSPTKVVARYRLDLAGRAVTHDGIAVDLRHQDASPDGMRDGGDGTVVVAFYNKNLVPAGRAGRYRLADGALVEEWTTPGSPRVTCPLVAEHAGAVKLILTTAVEGMPADMLAQCPNAGSLFVADTNLPAAPPVELVRLG